MHWPQNPLPAWRGVGGGGRRGEGGGGSGILEEGRPTGGPLLGGGDGAGEAVDSTHTTHICTLPQYT